MSSWQRYHHSVCGDRAKVELEMYELSRKGMAKPIVPPLCQPSHGVRALPSEDRAEDWEKETVNTTYDPSKAAAKKVGRF